MDNFAYLALGSNIEPRFSYLLDAVKALENNLEIKVCKVSSIYETDPVGYTDQGKFLNMAVKINTGLSPFELLDACLRIEKALGRKREIRWGPRTIDLDILLYNHENMETETLVLPHPRMHERAFVLVPLTELDNSLIHPVTKIPFAKLLEACIDREGIRLWKQISGEGVSALSGN
ncbi:2-amino-4-hydroxy-6-hydroxymethyldihydropteridine pyrophosphokinase [Weizmannia acidilactici]|jgi:2-amino-4-hydroxy-6-hydroxymethyldihydropteridine diphosphokinase|uniref:2-amino-4-hydroxy-6-hydroxymethyldihydropteridine diphosphokinase n=1 Tax=Weizmannia acidilactici TaxID=2607726 RepID=A0A5J4JIX0_9BACI|nr:2-amino-4-hydroxy-6-hydroxymethyldihydropteridine diphosphokinase [Weizmannia acidilactici]GER67620.1 2-amino-4-hydroxy-6-hydroxymethyldihydropteridine pyrophosphokinase [Weizmannia acidilactici]GER71219.1 2-amino-4-hydroxy-6-hydroxymethyldihydropteridine pyrophosphokinase [Weizmannia acidilactici]GER74648.1 2-amino-4-hydroxy-6-hydroxymethyldihydropteridine pyrophosphokinase [Weizmannia acidilactici]